MKQKKTESQNFKLQSFLTQGLTQPHFLGIKNRLTKITNYIICFKRISKKLKSGAGFTLIELIVVIAVMGVLVGAILVNFAGIRGARDLKIAQSQLVTNLRKIQSHTLSSRNITGDIPTQFYLMKFDRTVPTQYAIQAIYDVNVAPKLANLETIKFPEGISLFSTDPIEIDRDPQGPSGNDQKPTSCALIAFKAPFAKVIMNDGCSFANFVNDDYAKIKDFIANSSLLTSSTDSIMTIKLYESRKGTTKTVTINGVSGLISFQ